MDNNKCLLLEFVNEDKKIAVGYQDWLQDKISGEKKYLDIIEKKSEVKIKWPNCDIAPALIMKKRVKTCEWKTVVARILSFGEWTKMCQQRDNLEIYGILEATKEERKSMCKKQWSDDEEPEDSQRKKKYKKKEMNIETKSSKLWKELKTRKTQIESEQSSDDDSSSKMSQHFIQENKTLKKENNDLKNENVALRISLACIENLPKINNLVETILLKTEKIHDKIDLITDSNGNNLMENDILLTTEKIYKNDLFAKKNNSEATNNIIEMTSNKELLNNEKMINLGGKGVLVNAGRLRNCNRSSISQYTCDLLSVVFSKEELATSSLTGKIANTMKGANITPKPALNSKRLEAIEAHVFSIFECNKDTQKLFKAAVRQKCNNATPRASRRNQEDDNK
ncbi:uncharacterized protein LOC114944929 isoform X2 [Nylanderia fulva]|uniref:uncharacterized protein LOC114930346 isoform X2 n=1 Tax=Nylanderia fulva TaxID=613905 RepID=UPI0010FBA5A9|nr:uncharacterized protein LOC114930346 isoform X2 [Nylanderia fulva]XP_029176574.1 uncharacterized protein LOC114944696 isoform X2 [Nylanderia fulva]XP_029176825.1 uncharacterized protein LOC114944929 isoform X2 [Nylanderia fulva]